MPEKRGFFSFGFRVFVYLTAAFIVSNTLLYYTTDYSLGGSYYDTLVIFNIAKHATLVFTLTVNSLVYLVALGLVVSAALVMSHRISGPMYRFEKTARAVEAGDLTVVTSLRNNDYMRPQAEELNAAIKNMRERFAAITSRAASLKRKSDALEAEVPVVPSVSDGVLALIDGMKADNAEIKETLSYFKARRHDTGTRTA
jgi:methyl-accepting chemotaxis protein